MDSRVPIAVSWSGGKDSTMMVERLRDDRSIEIVALVTTVSTAYDRVSIHGVRRSILRRQAAALGYPLFEVELGSTSSNAQYATALADGLARLQEQFPHVNTMAFGDLFLEDVRAYRDELMIELDWRARYPLWGESTKALARQFVTRGYEAILTCVDTQQLNANFAGRAYDLSLLAELPASVDPCGERGEFHTCVIGGPIFRASIPVVTGERVLRDDRFQYCDLIDT